MVGMGRGRGGLVRRLKRGRIESQGVQRSELGEGRGGAETLKRRRKEEVLKRDSIPPPPKKPGRIALRQCALPASRRMGIFFLFIRAPFSLRLLSNEPVGLSMCCER